MENINNSNISQKIVKIKKSRAVQMVLFVILLELVFFPIPGVANISDSNAQEGLATDELTFSTPFKVKADSETKESVDEEVEDRELAWSKRVVMTAYNSEPGQTDDSPCVTANGFNVCEHGIEDTVAANFLKFGTEIRIPELFGDRVFVVRDRMNKRYTDRVDVWLLSKDNAIDFGVKYPLIEVLQ